MIMTPPTSSSLLCAAFRHADEHRLSRQSRLGRLYRALSICTAFSAQIAFEVSGRRRPRDKPHLLLRRAGDAELAGLQTSAAIFSMISAYSPRPRAGSHSYGQRARGLSDYDAPRRRIISQRYPRKPRRHYLLISWAETHACCAPAPDARQEHQREKAAAAAVTTREAMPAPLARATLAIKHDARQHSVSRCFRARLRRSSRMRAH